MFERLARYEYDNPVKMNLELFLIVMFGYVIAPGPWWMIVAWVFVIAFRMWVMRKPDGPRRKTYAERLDRLTQPQSSGPGSGSAANVRRAV